jgi:hypothetical protein
MLSHAKLATSMLNFHADPADGPLPADLCTVVILPYVKRAEPHQPLTDYPSEVFYDLNASHANLRTRMQFLESHLRSRLSLLNEANARVDMYKASSEFHQMRAETYHKNDTVFDAKIQEHAAIVAKLASENSCLKEENEQLKTDLHIASTISKGNKKDLARLYQDYSEFRNMTEHTFRDMRTPQNRTQKVTCWCFSYKEYCLNQSVSHMFESWKFYFTGYLLLLNIIHSPIISISLTFEICLFVMLNSFR